MKNILKYVFVCVCAIAIPVLLVINSLQALKDLLDSVARDGVVGIEMECAPEVAASIAELRVKCSQTTLVSNKYAGEFIDLTEEGGNLRAVVFLYDNE